MKILYFDCFAGSGGDMISAALISAGVDRNFLLDRLSTLGLKNVKIEVTDQVRHGIAALRFNPVIGHSHHHRGLKEVTGIIQASKISDRAKKDATGVFEILAKAEAKVHNTTPGKVHFHEVGAEDSITDIVSACLCIDALAPDKIYSSIISTGSGQVKCAHGIMPVPAPATGEIIREHNLPVQAGPGNFELLTPTAAAILAYFVDKFTPLPPMNIDRIGCGAGTKDAENFANVLRVMTGTELLQTDVHEEIEHDSALLFQFNVDDATGEAIAHYTDRFRDAGALDVWTSPIYMKKGRPALEISVLCEHEKEEALTDEIFRSGLTLGFRKVEVSRKKLARSIKNIETEYGKVAFKCGCYKGKNVFLKPEYQDCLRIAAKQGIGLNQVIRRVLSEDFSGKDNQ